MTKPDLQTPDRRAVKRTGLGNFYTFLKQEIFVPGWVCTTLIIALGILTFWPEFF
jgi:hypothetical protein